MKLFEMQWNMETARKCQWSEEKLSPPKLVTTAMEIWEWETNIYIRCLLVINMCDRRVRFMKGSHPANRSYPLNFQLFNPVNPSVPKCYPLPSDLLPRLSITQTPRPPLLILLHDNVFDAILMSVKELLSLSCPIQPFNPIRILLYPLWLLNTLQQIDTL